MMMVMMMQLMMMMNLCTAFMATLPCGSASSSAAKLSATFSHQNDVDDDVIVMGRVKTVEI